MKLRGLMVEAAVALTVLAVGSAAMAGSGTSTRIYHAFTSSGRTAILVTETVQGACFSGSAKADRNDAWRCRSDRFIYDPCFSSTKARGIVLCPDTAWQRSGIKINLTKPLPTKFGNRRAPSTDVRPWGMQTMSSANCVLESMGPFIRRKVFGDYACTNGKWLWNQPNRKAQPWTIFIAPVTATKLRTKAQIAIAWF
jgi:hypothetical protein